MVKHVLKNETYASVSRADYLAALSHAQSRNSNDINILFKNPSKVLEFGAIFKEGDANKLMDFFSEIGLLQNLSSQDTPSREEILERISLIHKHDHLKPLADLVSSLASESQRTINKNEIQPESVNFLSSEIQSQEFFNRLWNDSDGKALAAINVLSKFERLEKLISGIIFSITESKIICSAIDFQKSMQENYKNDANEMENFVFSQASLLPTEVQESINNIRHERLENAESLSKYLRHPHTPKNLKAKNTLPKEAAKIFASVVLNSKRIPHQAVADLLSVAFGKNVPASLVHEALRKKNKPIELRSKSVVSTKKTHKKSTITKKP